MKLLIVDNEVNTVELIKTLLLSKLECEVDVAYGGPQALEAMKKNDRYDLLILDIMMPVMSGLDVCELMAKDEKMKSIPVLLMSALPIASKTFQVSLERFKELNLVKNVLEKPFEVDDLIGKVKAIMAVTRQ